MIRSSLVILVSILVSAAIGDASSQPPLDKFTHDARATLAAGDYPSIYWIFVDSTAVADQPIPFTIRAHLRLSLIHI